MKDIIFGDNINLENISQISYEAELNGSDIKSIYNNVIN